MSKIGTLPYHLRDATKHEVNKDGINMLLRKAADRIEELERGLDDFTFSAHPDAFQGDESAMTEALVGDSAVQAARRLVGKR